LKLTADSHDLRPANRRIAAAAARGLSAQQKWLPPWMFYDEEGSALFDEICRLPEYYLTRAEIEILGVHGERIAAAAGSRARVVELGSGSGLKTGILLESLADPAEYVAIDISSAALQQLHAYLAGRFPSIPIRVICGDYMESLEIGPPPAHARRTMAFFPGSTVGNLEPADAERFLRRVGAMCGSGGGLLVGVDLRKDRSVIERAYNDSAGVTARFNMNVLRRLNREIGTDFDLSAFSHRAVYDEGRGRIEMQLVSGREQVVRFPKSEDLDRTSGEAGELPAEEIRFAAGEHIVTEHSYKYGIEGFAALGDRAGWELRSRWTDARNYFALLYLEREARTVQGRAA
jgi:dimethylhistidine N-methyltransferase